MICKNCGAYQDNNLPFCSHCGAKMEIENNSDNTNPNVNQNYNPNNNYTNAYTYSNPVDAQTQLVRKKGDAAFVISIISAILTISYGLSIVGLILGIIGWINGERAYKVTNEPLHKTAKYLSMVSTIISALFVVSIIIIILGACFGLFYNVFNYY